MWLFLKNPVQLILVKNMKFILMNNKNMPLSSSFNNHHSFIEQLFVTSLSEFLKLYCNFVLSASIILQFWSRHLHPNKIFEICTFYLWDYVWDFVMVFYFTCQSRPDLADKYIIYMGRDKFENEQLIKWVTPSAIWKSG